MDNRTCYLISKTKETYASSQNICLSYNATLAVLKDNNKKESVIKYTKEEDLWVGLEKDGGIWRWPDFTPLSPEEVENDAPELMCAILHSHYGALDCSSPRRFICMRDAD
ncbi:killer cell lectin-like receptor subfamily G member 2 [Ascaphus truei]|uniref:killer cell lectin-like receptor subfamily G member 2 n=1 Tax=Ascaphus truei TaxID=8439 RepID=UPI003F596AF9